MNICRLLQVCVAGAALFLSGPAWATEVGRMAPALEISQWVKGQEVDLESGRGKNVYVIDFWSTWSPACRTTIPRLSDLQKLLKSQGVICVGVSSEERSLVERYLEEMEGRMEYRVALDDDGQTTRAYMETFGVRGIPHTFVINKEGEIVWHGHPMGDLTKVLSQVLSGIFDAKRAMQAQKGGPVVEEYMSLAKAGEDTGELKAKGRTVLEEGAGRADLLNNFAWRILTDPSVQVRDLELALAAAKTAYEASGGRSAAIVDTYARASHEAGQLEAAIRLQKEAVELSRTAEEKEQFEKTLQLYENKPEE